MSAATSTANSLLPNQTLNQADFLSLLVTQMSSQDPLNPESNTDFAAQLAQFSSLQATQNMSGELQNIQATGLIGQTVTATPSTGGNAITGVVSGVQISAGIPLILINGQLYNMNQILAVTPTSAAATTPTGGTGSSSSSPSSSSPSAPVPVIAPPANTSLTGKTTPPNSTSQVSS